MTTEKNNLNNKSKSVSRSKSGSGKTTKTSTPKSKAKHAASKREQAARAAEQFRSLGVGVMLVGLMLGLWFLVLFIGVFMSEPTPGQIVVNVLAGFANIAVALVIVYLGYALYSERRKRFDTWQVAGGCFFVFALAALLHLSAFADGVIPAMKVAMNGFGGSICGFLAGLLVCWIPAVTARYIIVVAFLLLGLMLVTDMKIFALFGSLGNSISENFAAMKRAKAEAKEEAPAPQAVKKPNTAKNTKANVQDDEVISLPPIITDYSGRRFEETPRSDYDNVTVGDMLDDEGSLEIAGHTSKPNAEREIAVPAFLKWANLHKSKDKSAENQPVAVHSINEAVAPEVTEEKGIGTGDGEINVPQAGQYAQYEQTVKMTDYAANAEVTSEGNAETDVALANEAENKNSAENFREAAPTSYVAEAEPAAESAAAKSAGDEAHKVKSENAAPVRTELKRVVNYQLPPLSLMKGGITVKNSRINQKIMDDSVALENVLASFGVKTKVVEVVCGPAIIRYELQPAPGVKISKIVSLADDIALALAARGLRIEAPVPGKSVVGIEVAREETSPVYFKDVLNSEKFQRSKSKISIAFGMDINGGAVVGNLAEMPHLLIAGATGSGKSVCMNTLICSILYKAKPDEVKFIMVDPKKVEMTAYVGLPHLGRPVVTDAKKASQVLKEVVSEMDRRYLVFVNAGVKNFAAYNELPDVEKMPQIVVLIDELADLMMVASRDVEDSIVRLTQLARAAGIHLVIATQRPSVDVITGLIKANVPSRIAFAVSSQIDSRTILDMGGAEKLLGKGDMLYFPIGQQKPLRVQGAFLTEEEIHDLVAYCKQQAEPEYLELPLPDEAAEESEQEKEQQDELFIDACQQVISSGQASASSLQRRFRIGYNRAARLIETMQDLGIVSAPEGNKRTVLMNMPTFAATYLRSPEETSAANAAAEADNSGNAPEGNVEAAAENVEQSEDVFGENMRNENQG